jgi:ribosomal protein S12 methylthiotransferase accessory factor
MDEAGRGFCCGLAARLTLEAAASAAVLEMCQMELGLMLASMKRAAGQRLADGDRRHLERAEAIDASVCMLLQPDGAPVTRHAGRPDGAALRRLEAAFARLGITAAVVDLTRPDLGVPVVRAIAPALQPLPGKLTTARLDRTIAATGGGNPITGGVALL